MCQCAERRAAIAAGVRAIRRGDVAKAVDQAKFVVVSSGEDLRQAAHAMRIMAARLRLTR
jgi:hypothetical protein